MINLDVDNLLRDRIWDEIIFKEFNNFKDIFQIIKLKDNAKEDIWNRFLELYNICSKKYDLKDFEIDRHKFSACMMIAIVEIYPIETDNNPKFLAEKEKDYQMYLYNINEHLAITTGFSLLTSFALVQLKGYENLENNFKNGIKVPGGNLINHGQYINNYCKELKQSKEDKTLSILALSNELYLLELFTKINPKKI